MPKVKFVEDDIEVDVEPNSGLRDVCQSNDMTLPFGCENGVCGTCLITVQEGFDSLTEKTEQEKETLEALMGYEDQRLACQCSITDQDVVFDLD